MRVVKRNAKRDPFAAKWRQGFSEMNTAINAVTKRHTAFISLNGSADFIAKHDF